jgi:peptidoglycan/LPS O-acetylase OafA/YrhL
MKRPGNAAVPVSASPAESAGGSRRIPSLDGLRAVSILIVMASHLGRADEGAALRWLDEITLHGHLGVDIFFVISGYLITRLLAEERQRTGRVALGAFYLRRALRILPPFWVLLAVIGGLGLVGVLVLTPAELAESFLFVFNYHNPLQTSSWLSHTWSLSVEEQFYLLWPCVLALLGLARGKRVAALLIALVPALRIGLLLTIPGIGPRVDWMLPTRADMLMWGCLAALMEGQPAFERALASAFRLRLQWAAGLLLPLTGVFTHFLGGRYLFSVGYTAEGLAAAFVLAHAVRAPETLAGRLLNSKPAVWIGQRSYSLYLWQQPFLIPYNHTVTGRFPLDLVCIVAAAELSWLAIERPFQKLRKRLETGLTSAEPGHG